MNHIQVLVFAAITLRAPALVAQADSARTDSARNARRVRFFTERRCTDCHSFAVLKIKGAEVGPDLSSAYANVPLRYGMSLERFLDRPAGVMGAVLGGRSLGRAERDSIVTLLRNLYMAQLAKSDSAQRRARAVEEKRRS